MAKLDAHENWSLGSNNVAAPAQLPTSKDGERSVREAVNVDIIGGGEFRGRIGYERIVDVTSPRGLLKFKGSALFYVSGTSLYRFRPATGGSPEVMATVSGTARLVGTEHADELFMSVGNDHFRYDGITFRRWGVPPPPTMFLLSTAQAGTMQPGLYRVTVVYRNQRGEESRAAPIRTVELASVGGIAISGLGTPPDGCEALIYCSMPGSSILYLHTRSSGDTAVITQQDADGIVIGENFSRSPMSGEHMASHHGQILIASGRVMYGSIPFRPHLFSMTRFFFQFPEDITNVGSVGSGVFVTTEGRTYFLRDIETNEPSQSIVSDIGGYAGSMIDFDNKVVWMSEYGMAEGLESGEVRYPNRGFYSPVLAKEAVSGVVRHAGAERIVTTIKSKPSVSSLAASDYYDSQVVYSGKTDSRLAITVDFQTEIGGSPP